ncbi:protein NPAT [Mixophyes fleayi]|uniref:protein NPAT n=1 Tax=Mixophyes fleayi TaxID=3061075 RepID=UPI003F4D790C
MLLPSDVARLVLGYLQQEKLTSTCRSFITESPSLGEYADHYTDDGNIPGCLLSLFGKNLTTILNEYITMKAKENQAEIPYMMSSLWKKLDLTLSQIRCMQESAAFNTHQRARTRKGINERIRQKMLTSPLAASSSPMLHPVVHQTSTPIVATQYILQPLNTSGPLQSVASPLFGGQSTIQSSNCTTISIGEPTQSSSVILTQRKPPPAATSSPMRRKPEVQRRRRVAPLSSSTAAIDDDLGGDSDSVPAIIDDGFPQMVIENAREKILSNKCLQEKLAENINKFLGSDSAAQTSKQGEGVAGEHDPSIDEILGLQGGEMHMSEEAIHDILVQTELDPDFQELYDLFACVTSKAPKKPSRDPSAQNIDARNVTGKGKKQDAVERSLEVEPSNKKADVCSGGKEVAVSELPSQHIHKTTVEKTDNSRTSQQTFQNKITSSVNQSPKCNNQDTDLVIVDSTNSDILIDSSKESQRTIFGSSSSQSQDGNLKNNSDEAVEMDCQLVKEMLPQTTAAGEKSLLLGKDSTGKVNEELMEMQSSQVTTNERPSDGTQQEITKNVTATQSSMTVPQKVVLVSAGAPMFKCRSPQSEKDNRLIEPSKQSPLSKVLTNKPINAIDTGTSSEKERLTQNTAVNLEHAACHGQSSVASDIAALSSDVAVPSGSQVVAAPSGIVTLNIITEDVPEDAELRNAVRSINGDPTIILSPLVKSQDLKKVGPTQENPVIDLTDTYFSGDQSQVVKSVSDGSMGAINIPSGDCTVYSISGTSNAAGDGNVIKLMPATSSTFAPASNIFISTCMANNGPAKQSNIMMLSNNSAPSVSQKQPGLFQTPPRPGSMYTVGQAISPKLSQGSTIILASPVQPVLQGVVGMFPVSLVGQSGNTFTAPPHQILHVPVSKPVVPKLPLPPKSQKPALPKPIVNTGKLLSNPAADSSSLPSSSAVQRVEIEEKNCTSEIQNKPDDRLLADSTSVAAKPAETHRRVLCFDGTSAPTITLNSPSLSNSKSQKTDKNDTVPNVQSSSRAIRSNIHKENRKTECNVPLIGKNSKSEVVKAPGLISVPIKDQAGEKRPVAPSIGAFGNKENVLQTETEKQVAAEVDNKVNGQESVVGHCEKSVNPPQETARKQTSLPNILRRTPQKKSTERICPTSPLVKQASQLLHGMQFHSPNAKSFTVDDLPIPHTPGSGMDDKQLDNILEHTRTPTCKRYSDGGTPKLMKPPATPELPTCSPASEAGSESSVNMAAHTLMILSRASIAKSSSTTPLKDNIQHLKSSKSTSRKRKLEEADQFHRPSHSKEPLSPSTLQKKKMKKHRKKSMDCFPAGMDVDKFLMSLHYDE